jgi:hypothetical protein
VGESIDGARASGDRSVFRFLLKLEDGEPYDPAVFVTVIPSWTAGEEFLVTAHQRLRILAVDFDLDDELVARRFNAVWTVESA